MAPVRLCIAAALSALSFSFWVLASGSARDFPWPTPISGFCFAPLRAEHDPSAEPMPNAAQVEEDLALLAGRARSLRIYSVEGVQAYIPEIAARHGMELLIGAWLGPDPEKNARELTKLIGIAPQHTNGNAAVP